MDSDCIRFGPGTAVSLSGRDWNTCLNHCLPPFERTETVRRQPLLLNHRPHRVRTPRLQFAPSVFLRFYIDRSSSFRQSIQFLDAMVGVRTAEPYRSWVCHNGLWTLSRRQIYNPRFGNSLCALGAIVPPSVVEMYVYSRYCLPAGGLRRISSPGFTSWTFSP